MALASRGLLAVRALSASRTPSHWKPSQSVSRGPVVASKRVPKFLRPSKASFIPRFSYSTASEALNTSKPTRTRDEETELLVSSFQLAKTSTHTLPKNSVKRKMLELHTAEHVVKQMSEEERRKSLETIDATNAAGAGLTMEEKQQLFFSNVMTTSFLQDQLEQDAVSREEMLKFLAKPMLEVGEEASEQESYHRNLDVRVQHIKHLTAMAEGSLEIQQELVSANMTLHVLEMIPLSLEKMSVMVILLKALRVVATQELAVEQMLFSQKLKFIPLLVTLMRSSKDVSVRIEASALIALLTIVRDVVEALKQAQIVPALTHVLSSPMASHEQAIYNNGIVALVRIIAVSGDSIADDLKKAQAVTPLCNIINKLDRTPAVIDAVVTLLTILAGSPEIALQIVGNGCVPSLSKILASYVDFVSGKQAKERDFRRLTRIADSSSVSSTDDKAGKAKTNSKEKENASSASATSTVSALSAEEESFVDDDDAAEDEINPIYRGSDPEDILPLIRLLSRIPSARPQMIEYDVPKSLAALIADPNLPFSQKTQATNALVHFASETECVQAVVDTDVARALSLQSYDAGTSPEEITFQGHALAVLALFSEQESFQKHLAHKYWLSAVVPRAAKITQVPIQQAIGTILLSLLRGDRQDDIRDIIASSEPLRSTISHMVRQDQINKVQRSIWSVAFSLT